MTRVNKSKDNRIGPEPVIAVSKPIAIIDPEPVGEVVLSRKDKKKAKKTKK